MEGCLVQPYPLGEDCLVQLELSTQRTNLCHIVAHLAKKQSPWQESTQLSRCTSDCSRRSESGSRCGRVKHSEGSPCAPFNGTEVKVHIWNPFELVLAAAMIDGIDTLPVSAGSSVLLLSSSIEDLYHVHLSDG